MDFFIRKETRDDRLAKVAGDDIDLVTSPIDGHLVVVCMRDGVHVCGLCLEMFENDVKSPLRAVEYTPPGASERGENWGTRMHLHAKCTSRVASYPGNIVRDQIRGHQARRFLTKALKPFLGAKR